MQHSLVSEPLCHEFTITITITVLKISKYSENISWSPFAGFCIHAKFISLRSVEVRAGFSTMEFFGFPEKPLGCECITRRFPAVVHCLPPFSLFPQSPSIPSSIKLQYSRTMILLLPWNDVPKPHRNFTERGYILALKSVYQVCTRKVNCFVTS